MIYMEFCDPEAARSALQAAIEYLVNVDGYVRSEITAACESIIADQFEEAV